MRRWRAGCYRARWRCRARSGPPSLAWPGAPPSRCASSWPTRRCRAPGRAARMRPRAQAARLSPMSDLLPPCMMRPASCHSVHWHCPQLALVRGLGRMHVMLRVGCCAGGGRARGCGGAQRGRRGGRQRGEREQRGRGRGAHGRRRARCGAAAGGRRGRQRWRGGRQWAAPAPGGCATCRRAGRVPRHWQHRQPGGRQAVPFIA